MKTKPILLAFLLAAGCTTTYRVHVLDSAEQQVRNALVQRDTQIVDLEAVGRKLVADFGRKVAWKAVLGVWNELTGGAPLGRASDVMWLQDRGAHTQSVAWLIQFKNHWSN
jgi:hypothetical protein